MDRYVYSIFCDDIRQEIGNKMSLMGIYNGELHVATLPAVLSKLCVAIFCATSIENPFQSLSIKVTSDNVVLQEITVSATDLSQRQQEISSRSPVEDPISTIYLGVNVSLSPFVIEKEKSVIATVTADEQEIPAGRLRIKHTPNLVL